MHRIGKNDMKYAYLIMGRYDEKTDRAEIQDGKARIVGVKVHLSTVSEDIRTLQRE